MSKRPHDSQAPASASADLVERLKAAADDALLLSEIIESNDNVSVAIALSALLTGGDPSTSDGSKRRKKAANRPCASLPMEIFVEVVLFADRNTLDAMQLVCSFLLSFIRGREPTQLALRAISSVKIGKFITSDDYAGWLPCVELAPSPELSPRTVNQLALHLRMAFCESIRIDFDGAPTFLESPSYDDIYAMIWDDLFAPSTFVGSLSIRMSPIDPFFIHIFEAFESVNSVNVEWLYEDPDFEALEEELFVSATEHDVRHITLKVDDEAEGNTPASTAGALSFGFAEPTAGGDRSLLGVACGIGPDFLAQIKQKVSELNGARDIDFTFKLAKVSSRIDSTGFEKYLRGDGGSWLVNDLENHVNVEIKQTEGLVKIHVFSSV